MPGVSRITGPHPTSPMGFCLICAGGAKFAGLAGQQPEITAHEASGDGERIFQLDLAGFPPLAVTWSRIMALGIAGPVCWTHVEPIELRSGAVMPATPAEQAALNAQQHGAVHLDRPH